MDMSSVIAVPELIADTATDLANIGSTLNAANLAAATPTIAVAPAAADEVSVSIARLFSQEAQDYQALAAQAAAFHEQFIQQLTASAASYASAEAANVRSLQPPAASAAPFASATAAFGSQLSDLYNTLVSELPGLFLSFATLLPFLIPLIAIGVGLILLLALGVVFLAAAA
jgi:hypothetical protein